MLPCFTGVLHVSNLSTGEHLMAVLEQVDCFTKQELSLIGKKVSNKRYGISRVLEVEFNF